MDTFVTLEFPEGCTQIRPRQFALRPLPSCVIVPRQITRIGEAAFFQCTDVEHIILEGVEQIDKRAFQNCYNLKTITLPDTLKKIGCCAFSDCRKLTELVIPESVEETEEAVVIHSMPSLRRLEKRCSARIFRNNFDAWEEIDDDDDEYCYTPVGYSLSRLEDGYLPNEDLLHIHPEDRVAAVRCYLSSRERYSPQERQTYDYVIQSIHAELLEFFIENDWTASLTRLLRFGYVDSLDIINTVKETEDIALRALLLDQLGRQGPDYYFESEY